MIPIRATRRRIITVRKDPMNPEHAFTEGDWVQEEVVTNGVVIALEKSEQPRDIKVVEGYVWFLEEKGECHYPMLIHSEQIEIPTKYVNEYIGKHV